jgi:hypothetical protein
MRLGGGGGYGGYVLRLKNLNYIFWSEKIVRQMQAKLGRLSSNLSSSKGTGAWLSGVRQKVTGAYDYCRVTGARPQAVK